MPYLKDLDESEKLRAKTNSRGEILCLHCNKNPAKISEYGMLRKCDECSKEKYNVMVMIDEPSGRRTY